ncbi:MAG: hypothetical protein KC550_03935 [Nanoarchaeota archaeon]|nr:hypothetical protein [Nanoarchaeota archaeon]
MFFFKSSFNSKKSVVSLTTYIMILFLSLLILIFSQNFYSNSKSDVILKIDEKEVLNSVLMFRESMLNLASYSDSNLTYVNNYDLPEIEIFLDDNGKKIVGKMSSGLLDVSSNISSLGLSFCSNYSFSPVIITEFNFNGSCISKLS